MKLLAIEAATEACSAAVLVADDVFERYEVAPRQHNQLLLPMCEQVLSEAGLSLSQLDGIAFGCGPGAFTGVRIAAGVTQGIAFAHDLPVAPVSTLANLAFQANAEEGELIMPAIDARMEEVYWAQYRKLSPKEVILESAERVGKPSEICMTESNISVGLGTGWGTYKTELINLTDISENKVNPDALPRARVTGILGAQMFVNQQGVDAEQALPVYLRDNVTYKKI